MIGKSSIFLIKFLGLTLRSAITKGFEMRTRIVKRFHCDYCKKANLQERAMARHELHCTLNPHRKCRVCTLINGGYDTDLKALLAILPDPTEYNNQSGCYGDSEISKAFILTLNEAYQKLSKAADYCPACIMAALRQKKIYLSDVNEFNYAEEMKHVFKVANEERYEGVSCY